MTFLWTDCSRTSNDCSIPIRHSLSTTPNTVHYYEYRSWAVGDMLLDWHGVEHGQGSVNGKRAAGSPSVWTTDDQSNNAAYHPLNRYYMQAPHSNTIVLGL